MSAIDLFLLGEILLNPQSPYELATFIKTNELNNVVKISTPAVYKNIRKLAQSGYLTTEAQKDSESPEKKRYQITEKGMCHYRELLFELSKKRIPFHYDFNAIIVNLLNIEKGEGIELLSNIEKELKRNSAYLQQAGEKYVHLPFTGIMIIEQHKLVNAALIQWITMMREKLYQS